ncbi:MAG TPA: cytochrome c [Bryobacterales bacterium]|nr:cytochrome c [Bryobacterales bacterium]
MKKLMTLAVAVLLSLAVSVSYAQKESKKHKGKKEETTAAKGDPAKGKDVFEAKCMVCHNPDSKDKKIGPGLQGVKDGKLPSGKDATHDTILQNVNNGGNGMPAFKELLTDEEKEDVVAYVLTL